MPLTPEHARISREQIAEAFDVPPEFVESDVELEITYVPAPTRAEAQIRFEDVLRALEEFEESLRRALEPLIETARRIQREHPALADSLSPEALDRIIEIGRDPFGPTITPELGILEVEELVPVRLEECFRCRTEIPRDDDLGLCAGCREELRAL